MDFLISLFGIIGSMICHQIPERTILIGGNPLPLCARDTGIYTGVLTGFTYLTIRKRLDADKPTGVFTTSVLCLLMLPMLFDGISSYIGLRDTTNTIRLLTGIIFGMSLPFFLVPAANFKVNEKNEKLVADGPGDIILLTVVNIAAGIAILRMQFIPWLVLAGISISGFILLIIRIAYTLIVRSMRRRGTAVGILTCVLTLLLLTIIYLFSTLLLQPVKNILSGNL